MIPENVLSSTPVPKQFQLLPRVDPFISSSFGGSDIGQTDIGKNTFIWYGEFKDGKVKLWNSQVTHYVLDIEERVYLFDFTFTQNMSPVLSWQTKNGAFLKFYNTATAQDEIMEIPDATNISVKLDELRPELISMSDVIVSYQKKGETGLFVRYQRDRYLVEHKLSSEDLGYLKQTGMMDGLRFGWAFTDSVKFKFI